MEYSKNIRYASPKNLNEITALWNMCFPESPEFTKWYFEKVFSLENTLIYTENGKITAMLQEIPLQFNNSQKATYIYGACTHPLHRKKGIMSRLLTQSFKNDIKKGIPQSILIPENEELFKFYEKFGYKKTTLVKKEIFKYSDFSQNLDDEYIFKKADFSDIENINSLYEKTLLSNNFILRDNSFWKNQIQMFNDLGGGCFCLYKTNNPAISAYAFVWRENTLQAQEICFKDNKVKNILCENLLLKLNSKRLECNAYDKKGEYKACVKFHNKKTENNISVSDYIINLLWN